MKLHFSLSLGYVCLLIAMAAVNSCEHKDFCYDHDHKVSVNLVFDWSNAPDANPKGMRVFFYPADDSELPVEQFNFTNNIKGGEIRLNPGHYRMIAYNNDTELAKPFDLDDYFSHHFYTRNASLLEPVSGNRYVSDENIPRPFGSDGQTVVACPDQLWGCSDLNVKIKSQVDSVVQTVTVFPSDLICHYSYEVRNVRNIQSVSAACAALSGMSPYINLHDTSLGERSIILPLECHRADSTTIKGEFLTFGHSPVNDTPHRFGLYVWLADGTSKFYTERDDFDVTDQIHSASDPHNVHFIIDGLNLPEVVGDGANGAWNATFEDWNVVNEEITL